MADDDHLGLSRNYLPIPKGKLSFAGINNNHLSTIQYR
jgi:hypothetical protein